MGSAKEARSPEKSALELLQEFRTTGRQESFEEIVRRYAGMVFHVCLKVTKNAHDAEDATQAVFLTLAVQAKTAREIRYIGPWLQQVAHRVALDMRKSKNRRQLREEQHGAIALMRSDPETNGNGAHALDVEEMKGLMGEELNKLPPKYRLPLILHYYGGLSREAMAKELNCKPATLGVRLHRGREMLANRLASRGLVLAEASMAVALACYVHSSVNDSLVAATCQAASSLVAGRDLQAGLVSAQVVRMARGAVKAVLMAKLKLAALVALAAGTALAAGAEVVAKIHPMDLQWQLNLGRLLRPLVQPLLRPSFTQAAPPTPAPAPEAKLELAADPLLQPVDETGMTSWPAGAVLEGTAPVYIPPAAPPAEPATVATSSPTVMSLPLLGSQQPAPAPGVNHLLLPPGQAVMVLGGQPAANSNKFAASEGTLRGFASAPMAALPPVRPGDALTQLKSAPSPQYFQPLVSARMQTPLVMNTPLGPRNVDGTFNGIAPAAPSTPTTLTNGAGAAVAPPSHGTIYLNPAPPPASSNPASLQPPTTSTPALSVVTAADSSNSALGQAIVVATLDHLTSYSILRPMVYADASTSTVMMDAGTDNASMQPRMLAQINGTPLSSTSNTLQGWGVVGPADAFDQNGRVIADGQGAAHTLDLSQVGVIHNTIDNPVNQGVNGWFAQNGGKLVLPPLHIAPGGGTYAWGEDSADAAPDLVNSLKLSVSNAPRAGTVSVALLSVDRADYPGLPTSDRVLDVWQLEGTSPGAMLVTVRYDDGALSSLGLGESRLSLWQFDNGWGQVTDSLALDMAQKTIAGAVDSPSYLALSAPELASLAAGDGSGDASGLPGLPGLPGARLVIVNAPQGMVVVPEPAGMLALATAGYLLARRRRRR